MATRLAPVAPIEGMECPPLLLASLREIEPTAELMYFGDGNWRLFSRRPTNERAEAGAAILENERHRDIPNPRNIILGHMLKAGYAMIAEYTCKGNVSVGPYTDGDGTFVGSIVEDLRERDFNYRRDQGEAHVAARMDDTLGVTARAEDDKKFKDYLVNDGRDHYRREIRNRVMFGVGGMTGGSGRIIIP